MKVFPVFNQTFIKVYGISIFSISLFFLVTTFFSDLKWHYSYIGINHGVVFLTAVYILFQAIIFSYTESECLKLGNAEIKEKAEVNRNNNGNEEFETAEQYWAKDLETYNFIKSHLDQIALTVWVFIIFIIVMFISLGGNSYPTEFIEGSYFKVQAGRELIPITAVEYFESNRYAAMSFLSFHCWFSYIIMAYSLWGYPNLLRVNLTHNTDNHGKV